MSNITGISCAQILRAWCRGGTALPHNAVTVPRRGVGEGESWPNALNPNPSVAKSLSVGLSLTIRGKKYASDTRRGGRRGEGERANQLNEGYFRYKSFVQVHDFHWAPRWAPTTHLRRRLVLPAHRTSPAPAPPKNLHLLHRDPAHPRAWPATPLLCKHSLASVGGSAVD